MKCINGDKVQFHSTSDAELDSLTGTVIGLSFDDPIASHYIVLLDKRYSKYPWDAIQITEHCLKMLPARSLDHDHFMDALLGD